MFQQLGLGRDAPTAVKAWATASEVTVVAWLMDCELDLAIDVALPVKQVLSLMCSASSGVVKHVDTNMQ